MGFMKSAIAAQTLCTNARSTTNQSRLAVGSLFSILISHSPHLAHLSTRRRGKGAPNLSASALSEVCTSWTIWISGCGSPRLHISDAASLRTVVRSWSNSSLEGLCRPTNDDAATSADVCPKSQQHRLHRHGVPRNAVAPVPESVLRMFHSVPHRSSLHPRSVLLHLDFTAVTRGLLSHDTSCSRDLFQIHAALPVRASLALCTSRAVLRLLLALRKLLASSSSQVSLNSNAWTRDWYWVASESVSDLSGSKAHGTVGWATSDKETDEVESIVSCSVQVSCFLVER